MARARMTVNRLHKELGKLIEQGLGKTQVCINKRTFTHSLEPDGCCILPVDGVEFEHIRQMDGDGFTATTKRGHEIYRRTVVLLGESGVAFKDILNPKYVTDIIHQLGLEKIENHDVVRVVVEKVREFAETIRQRVGSDEPIPINQTKVMGQ